MEKYHFENILLVNIQRDFLKNKLVLDTVINNTKNAIQSGLQILNHTGTKAKPSNEDELNKMINGVCILLPYYPQNGFLDDLVNSGKLGIFKNVELRNLLSSWYSTLNIHNINFQSANADEVAIEKFVIKNGSWLNADDVLTFERKIEFPSSGFEIDNRDLLGVLEFENLIENQIISLDNYLTSQINTMALLEEIIETLEGEIK